MSRRVLISVKIYIDLFCTVFDLPYLCSIYIIGTLYIS